MSTSAKLDEMSTGWPGTVLITLLLGCLYFLGARLGLALQLQNVAVFWPASGLSVGALIALGPSYRWPIAAAVLLATAAANLLHGSTVATAVAFGACNVVEALLAALIVEQFSARPFRLDRLHRVFGFFAASIIGTAIAAIGAAQVLKSSPGVETPLANLWRFWFESDAIGIITVAPLLIALPSLFKERTSVPGLVEGLIGLVLIGIAAVSVFAGPSRGAFWSSLAPLGLLFPPLLWLAARCHPVFAAGGSLIVALVIVWSTGSGEGWLSSTVVPLPDRVFAAQLAMLTYSICTLSIAALVAELRSVAAALRTSEQRLRIASSAARLGVFEWHAKEDRTVWENDRMYELFGHKRADGTISRKDFVERYLDPADRERTEKELTRGILAGEVDLTCRIRRKDGMLRDIHILGTVEVDTEGHPERRVGIAADITERRRNEEHQRLLMGELDHRVKNALERVSTVVRTARIGATSIDSFVETLEGRIQAMARAHQLLSRGRWKGVSLAALVAEQIEPYAAPDRFAVAGPEQVLGTDATQALAMVLHELVTNAAKYSALSNAAGRIVVRWQLTQSEAKSAAPDTLEFEWSETGGPPVGAELRPGFGTRVIRELIRYELGGTVDFGMLPQGVRCMIAMPLSRVGVDG